MGKAHAGKSHSAGARGAASVLGALLCSGALSGCGHAPEDTTSADTAGGSAEEKVAEATEGLTSARVCLSIRRQGAAGSVFDTGIVNRAPPKNFGASGTMNVGPYPAPSGDENQVLLRFDLSAIPSGPSTNIQTASVNLARGLIAPSGPATIEVHNVLAPWSESTVTWQSFGGAYAPAVLTTFSNQPTYPSFTITSHVQDWVRGNVPNHGVLLKTSGASSTNLWTSEYSLYYSRPELFVCYTVTCSPGFADCNNDGRDGCETNLAVSGSCVGHVGEALVCGGETMESASYSAVVSLGGPLGGATASSPSYRLRGGLIGATQGP